MNNNLLPMKKKDNIFKKIKDFFSRLFKKEENNYLTDTISSEEPNIDKYNIFAEELKINVSNEPQKIHAKDEFIKELENNRTLLENLSLDRLESLSKYYDELLEKDKLELKKLSAN